MADRDRDLIGGGPEETAINITPRLNDKVMIQALNELVRATHRMTAEIIFGFEKMGRRMEAITSAAFAAQGKLYSKDYQEWKDLQTKREKEEERYRITKLKSDKDFFERQERHLKDSFANQTKIAEDHVTQLRGRGAAVGGGVDDEKLMLDMKRTGQTPSGGMNLLQSISAKYFELQQTWGAISTAFGTVAGPAMRWNAIMTDQRRQIGLTNEEFKDYSKQIERISETEHQTTADTAALADVYNRLHRELDTTRDKSIKGMVQGFDELRYGVGLTAEEAQDLTIDFVQLFGRDQSGLKRSADNMAIIRATTTLTKEEMLKLFEVSKSWQIIMEQAGISGDQIFRNFAQSVDQAQKLGFTLESTLAFRQGGGEIGSRQNILGAAFVSRYLGRPVSPIEWSKLSAEQPGYAQALYGAATNAQGLPPEVARLKGMAQVRGFGSWTEQEQYTAGGGLFEADIRKFYGGNRQAAVADMMAGRYKGEVRGQVLSEAERHAQEALQQQQGGAPRSAVEQFQRLADEWAKTSIRTQEQLVEWLGRTSQKGSALADKLIEATGEWTAVGGALLDVLLGGAPFAWKFASKHIRGGSVGGGGGGGIVETLETGALFGGAQFGGQALARAAPGLARSGLAALGGRAGTAALLSELWPVVVASAAAYGVWRLMPEENRREIKEALGEIPGDIKDPAKTGQHIRKAQDDFTTGIVKAGEKFANYVDKGSEKLTNAIGDTVKKLKPEPGPHPISRALDDIQKGIVAPFKYASDAAKGYNLPQLPHGRSLQDIEGGAYQRLLDKMPETQTEGMGDLHRLEEQTRAYRSPFSETMPNVTIEPIPKGVGDLRRMEERNYPLPSGQAAFGDPRAQRYTGLINQAAEQNRLDPYLIESIIATESKFNPRAVSGEGAAGLMQLMPKTAKGLGAKNVYDPKENVMVASREFARLLRHYHGDIATALSAYNWGQGNLEGIARQKAIKAGRTKDTGPMSKEEEIAWGMEHRPSETKTYVKRVMGGLQMAQTDRDKLLQHETEWLASKGPINVRVENQEAMNNAMNTLPHRIASALAPMITGTSVDKQRAESRRGETGAAP